MHPLPLLSQCHIILPKTEEIHTNKLTKFLHKPPTHKKKNNLHKLVTTDYFR